MFEHDFNIGQEVVYNGIEATITSFDGPATIEIYGMYGVRYSPKIVPHRYKFLAFFGFKEIVIAEKPYKKHLQVSCRLLKNK